MRHIRSIAARYLRTKMAAKFWGQAGTGVIFICQEDGTVLLLKRAPWVQSPNTWGIPGGGMTDEEVDDASPLKRYPLADLFRQAKIEVKEELGSFPQFWQEVGQTVFKSQNWRYTSFILNIPLEEKQRWTKTLVFKDHENTAADWFKPSDLPSPLHPGIKFSIQQGALKTIEGVKSEPDLKVVFKRREDPIPGKHTSEWYWLTFDPPYLAGEASLIEVIAKHNVGGMYFYLYDDVGGSPGKEHKAGSVQASTLEQFAKAIDRKLVDKTGPVPAPVSPLAEKPSKPSKAPSVPPSPVNLKDLQADPEKHGFSTDVKKNRVILDKLPVEAEIRYFPKYSWNLVRREKTSKGNFLSNYESPKELTNLGMAKSIAEAVIANHGPIQVFLPYGVQDQVGEAKVPGDPAGFTTVMQDNRKRLKTFPVGTEIRFYFDGKMHSFKSEMDGTFKLEVGGFDVSNKTNLAVAKMIASVVEIGEQIVIDTSQASSATIPLDPEVEAPTVVKNSFAPSLYEGMLSSIEVENAPDGSSFVFRRDGKEHVLSKTPYGTWSERAFDKEGTEVGGRTKFYSIEVTQRINDLKAQGIKVDTRSYPNEPPVVKMKVSSPTSAKKYLEKMGAKPLIEKFLKEESLLTTEYPLVQKEMDFHYESILLRERRFAKVGVGQSRVLLDSLADLDEKQRKIYLSSWYVGQQFASSPSLLSSESLGRFRSYLDKWRSSSYNSDSLQLHAYAQARGFPGSYEDQTQSKKRKDYSKKPEIMSKVSSFFDTVYAFTQAYFQKMGVSSLRLYRGFLNLLSTRPPNKGDLVTVQTRPLSSWSSDPTIAAKFGKVAVADIPVEHIWASPITDERFAPKEVSGGWEAEYIVLGASEIVCEMYNLGESLTEPKESDPLWTPKVASVATDADLVEVYRLDQIAENDNWMQILRAEHKEQQRRMARLIAEWESLT